MNIPNDRKRTKINVMMPPRRKTENIKDTCDCYRFFERTIRIKQSLVEEFRARIQKKPHKSALREFIWIGPYWQNILGHYSGNIMFHNFNPNGKHKLS
jgi:hypothetical protein